MKKIYIKIVKYCGVAMRLFSVFLIVVQMLCFVFPTGIESPTEGAPIIKKTNPNCFFAEITQVIGVDDYVYLLYGNNSVVQVYFQNGEYQHTIFFSNTNSGRMVGMTYGNRVIIKDKEDNVYSIIEGAVVDYYSANDVEDRLKYDHNSVKSNIYGVKANCSIWVLEHDRPVKEIIKRPTIMFFLQYDILIFLIGSAIYVVTFVLEKNGLVRICISGYVI